MSHSCKNSVFKNLRRTYFFVELQDVYVTSDMLKSVVKHINDIEKHSRSRDYTLLFMSYVALLQTIPSPILEKLNLMFKEDLRPRLRHLYYLAKDALSLEHAFFEGFEVNGKLAMPKDLDLYDVEANVVMDYTSDFTRRFIKKDVLDYWEKFGLTAKVHLIKKGELRLDFSESTVMQHLCESFIKPDFQVAKDFFFDPLFKNQCLSDREKIISMMEEKMPDINQEKEREVHVYSELQDLIDTNSPDTIDAFETKFSGTKTYEQLMDYIHSSRRQKIKKLYHAPPECDTKNPDEDGTEFLENQNLSLEEADGDFVHAMTTMVSQVRRPLWMFYDLATHSWQYCYNKDPELVKLRKSKLKLDSKIPSSYKTMIAKKINQSGAYDILFDVDHFLKDRHLKRVLSRAYRPHDYFDEEEFIKNEDKISYNDEETALSEVYKHAMAQHEEHFAFAEQLDKHNCEETELAEDNIFEKLCDNAENLVPSGGTLKYVLEQNKLLKVFYRTKLMNSVAHEYEVAKGQVAALSVRRGYHRWYPRHNGCFRSVTFFQLNKGPVDWKSSFNMTFYAKKGKWYKHKSVSFNTNSIHYAITKPAILDTALRWAHEQKLSMRVGSSVDFDCDIKMLAALICVNKDTCAQMQDLTRYAYNASTSYGSDLSKVFKKLDPIFPSTWVEIIYAARLIKTTTALDKLWKNGKLTFPKGSNGVSYVMPQNLCKTESLHYTVSSFYTSRLYNNEKAAPETSEAVCYKGILEELDIFRSSLKDMPRADSSAGHMEKIASILNNEDFMTKRFSSSPYAVCSLGHQYSIKQEASSKLWTTSVCAIGNFHAAMKGRQVEYKNQVSKSSLCLIEYLNFLQNSKPDKFKSLSLYVNQMLAIGNKIGFFLSTGGDSYRYASYIVKKDQVGHREIYVMNTPMRMGAFLIEEFARMTSTQDEVNVQNNPNKDKCLEEIFQQALTQGEDGEGKKGKHKTRQELEEGLYEIYDNADASRWGPNMIMQVLAAQLACSTHEKDVDVFFMGMFVLNEFTRKQVKVPESLIRLFENIKDTLQEPVKGTARQFVHKNRKLLDRRRGPWHVDEETGMGQGIFQEFSSVLHGTKQRIELELLDRWLSKRDIEVKSKRALVTSDDSFKFLKIKFGKGRDKAGGIWSSGIWDFMLHVNGRLGSLFSIIRNMAKSGYHTHRAEFNSKFIGVRSPAMPTLKFRCSKIEIGSGENLFSDLKKSLTSGSDYLSSGGSYLGAYSVTVANYTLFLEQWRTSRRALTNLKGKCSMIGYVGSLEPLCLSVQDPTAYLVITDLEECYKTMSMPPELQFVEEDLDNIASNLSISANKVSEELYKQVESIEYNHSDDIYTGFICLMRRPRASSVFLKKFKKKSDEVSSSLSFVCPISKPSNLTGLVFSLTEAAKGMSSKEGNSYFHTRFGNSWHSRSFKCFVKTKTDLCSQVIDVGDKFSYSDLLHSSNDPSIHDRLYRRISTVIEVDHHQKLAERCKPFFYEQMKTVMQLKSEIRNKFTNSVVLRCRNFARMGVRNIDENYLALIGREAAAQESLAKFCGKQAEESVLFELGNVLGFRDSVKLYKPKKLLPVKDVLNSFEKSVQRLSRLSQSRKTFMLPSRYNSYKISGVLTHLMHCNIMEGMGSEVAMDIATVSAYEQKIMLINDEQANSNALQKAAGEHLGAILKGEDSNMLDRYRAKGAPDLNEFLIQKPDSFRQLQAFRVILANLKTECFNGSIEVCKTIINGELTAASMSRLGTTQLWVYKNMHTKIQGELPMVVVRKYAHKNDFKYSHHFFFGVSRSEITGHSLDYITLTSVVPKLEPYEPYKAADRRVYRTRRPRDGADDQVYFHYPEDLTLCRLESSRHNTLIYLVDDKSRIYLPITPIKPDKGSFSFPKYRIRQKDRSLIGAGFTHQMSDNNRRVAENYTAKVDSYIDSFKQNLRFDHELLLRKILCRQNSLAIDQARDYLNKLAIYTEELKSFNARGLNYKHSAPTPPELVCPPGGILAKLLYEAEEEVDKLAQDWRAPKLKKRFFGGEELKKKVESYAEAMKTKEDEEKRSRETPFLPTDKNYVRNYPSLTEGVSYRKDGTFSFLASKDEYVDPEDEPESQPFEELDKKKKLEPVDPFDLKDTQEERGLIDPDKAGRSIESYLGNMALFLKERVKLRLIGTEVNQLASCPLENPIRDLESLMNVLPGEETHEDNLLYDDDDLDDEPLAEPGPTGNQDNPNFNIRDEVIDEDLLESRANLARMREYAVYSDRSASEDMNKALLNILDAQMKNRDLLSPHYRYRYCLQRSNVIYFRRSREFVHFLKSSLDEAIRDTLNCDPGRDILSVTNERNLLIYFLRISNFNFDRFAYLCMIYKSRFN